MWHLLPCITQAAFLPWGQLEVDLWASSCTNNINFITLQKTLPPGALGLNAFNQAWKFWMSYIFHSPALFAIVLSKFLVEHVTSQCRLLITVAACWVEAPWLPTVFNILKDIPYQYPIVKTSHHAYFKRLGGSRVCHWCI